MREKKSKCLVAEGKESKCLVPEEKKSKYLVAEEKKASASLPRKKSKCKIRAHHPPPPTMINGSSLRENVHGLYCLTEVIFSSAPG